MKKITIVILIVILFVLAIAVSPASACGCGPGVGTPGYWKNHPEAWPVEEITIGGITYTKAEAIEIMKMPGEKDKSITLFRAVVAATLNVEIGNCDWCIPNELDFANDYWFFHFPVGSGVRGNSDAWHYFAGEATYLKLDAYNNGLDCAVPRD